MLIRKFSILEIEWKLTKLQGKNTMKKFVIRNKNNDK